MPNNKFSFSRDDLFGEDPIETVTQSLHDKKLGERMNAVGRLQYRGYRDRKETEELIKNILKEAGKAIKFRAVAKGLDRAASPHLRVILDEMAERGEIVKTQDISPNEQLPRYWYSLPTKNSRS